MSNLEEYKTITCVPHKANAQLLMKTRCNQGFDLKSVEEYEIAPGERKIVDTGLIINFPDGYFGLIWPRSGLAVKNGIDVLAGVIDSSYRGVVGVVLINHGDKSYFVEKGDRVAQLIIQREVEVEFEWGLMIEDTNRGDKGFGSSGK